MTFSRRHFLSLMGISIAAWPLRSITFGIEPNQHLFGRALEATPVYAPGHTAADPVTMLWPDSIVPIHGRDGHWYRLDEGFAHVHHLQPIETFSAAPVVVTPSSWAVVAGGAAVVRAWCAADAPALARIGHGGVAHVDDWLPGPGGGWYHVTLADGRGGWTGAANWRPVAVDVEPLEGLPLRLERHMLRATIDSAPAFETLVSRGAQIRPGRYALTRDVPATHLGAYHGIPWALRFGQHQLAGAYWHNQFGADHPGPAVQIAPAVARWLYRHVNVDTALEIH